MESSDPESHTGEIVRQLELIFCRGGKRRGALICLVPLCSSNQQEICSTNRETSSILHTEQNQDQYMLVKSRTTIAQTWDAPLDLLLHMLSLIFFVPQQKMSREGGGRTWVAGEVTKLDDGCTCSTCSPEPRLEMQVSLLIHKTYGLSFSNHYIAVYIYKGCKISTKLQSQLYI